MARLKDIAKRADLSIAAVSYALNGSRKVSRETRDKVLKIAEELQYAPNFVGRSLQSKKTNVIAIYFQDYSGSFYGRMLAGVTKELQKFDYDLIVCSGRQSHDFLPMGLVDGGIILDSSFSNEELISYADAGIKLIVLDRKLEHHNISNILLDNESGAKKATQLLLRQNIEKIFIIQGPSNSYSSKIRKEVALNEIVASGKKIEVEILDGDFSTNTGFQHAPLIHETLKEKNVGVFSLNDNMAIGLLIYFKDTPSVIIGENIHIVGFDAEVAGQLSSPALTTVYFSQTEWGTLAAKSLLDILGGKKGANYVLPTTLLLGESVGQTN